MTNGKSPEDSAAVNYAKLINKRGAIKGRITRFEKFVAAFGENQDIFNLKLRLENIEKSWTDFDEVQSEIETSSEHEGDEERNEFEEKYYNIVAATRKIIHDRDEALAAEGASSEASKDINEKTVEAGKTRKSDDPEDSGDFKMAPLTLPTFDGNYDGWAYFRDTYKLVVNTNKRITDIHRFHYLQTSLKGQAAQVIEALPPSAANYKVAWELLEKRYDNEKLLINHHIQALFNLAPMVKETASGLRGLSDAVSRHLRALENLGQLVDAWDAIIIYLISNKLDPDTKREWERKVVENDWSTHKDFTDFLANRSLILENVQPATVFSTSAKTAASKPTNKGSSMSNVATGAIAKACSLCQGNHQIYQCSRFTELTIANRLKETKRLGLCVNCLGVGHRAQDCSSGSCRRCHKRHNTLLHFLNKPATETPSHGATADSTGNQSDQQREKTVASASSTIVTHSASGRSQVLLSTALIFIRDAEGQVREARALLDSGSQSNFITKSLCNQLGLQKTAINQPIVGVGGATSRITRVAHATIESQANSYRAKLPFLVIDEITEQIPTVSFSTQAIDMPSNISLADPEYNISRKIDLLLGASIYLELLCMGQIKLGKGQPFVQKTKLGWIIAGPMSMRPQADSCSTFCGFSTLSDEVEDQLERFWKLEELQEDRRLSKEEQIAEDVFILKHQRAEDGRFIVDLPFKGDVSKLGESRETALKRFSSLERKLARDAEFRTQYIAFMDNYDASGYMTKLRDAKEDDGVVSYYIPHHGVRKESSTTTKMRVVFDASCKTSTGVALNDVLSVGPVIQPELFDTIVQFRENRYVITADIAQMYLRVLLNSEHRNLQRIVWRKDTSKPVEDYVLNTVTFGLASSGFCAIRCLKQLAIENEEKFPEASKVIAQNFYVDDLLKSDDDPKRLQRLKSEISDILASAGFTLRKWASNHPEALSSDDQASVIHIGEDVNALGITWEPAEDCLRFKTVNQEEKARASKRVILSVISQIFDPLGLIGPCTIRAKMLLQELWRLKMNWDESLPADLYTAWREYGTQLSNIGGIRVPRHISCEHPIRSEMHGFCDASEKAYGACLYLRSTDSNGHHLVRLICSKSRVAPLKSVCLARLELCGALLLARLLEKIRRAITKPILLIRCWCDSEIALAWIAREPTLSTTFVRNRVAAIQELISSECWKHVSSADNPADLISRGINVIDMTSSDLWWKGPSWLSKNSEEWPANTPPEVDELPETRRIQLVFAAVQPSYELLKRFSSLKKLQRITAYWLRFKHNALHKLSGLPTRNGALTVEELDNAMVNLIRLAQHAVFEDEFQCLQSQRALRSNSSLITLNPFVDDRGIIRVGGRLKEAPLVFTQKFPIVLPAKGELTELIIRDAHLQQLHMGPQALLASLRERYWPLRGREAIRRVLRKCVTCFRYKPVNLKQLMADLPAARVTPGRAFINTGVDYAGPFNVKVSRNKTTKAYLCVFICLATKAVHLELVSDLTTQAFLNAFKRFISRRGMCLNIYSDNGTNFVGASSRLNGLYELLSSKDTKNKFNEFFVGRSMRWHFIPPQSPHVGGLWEAAVKSAKTHLRKVMGETLLSFEELYTLIVQIEACLNSRPLYPLSSDPADLSVLTPAHFLVGEPLTTVPNEDLQNVAVNRVTRFQLLIKMQQHFWTRWSNEYVTQLQQRYKWQQVESNPLLKVGALVLIKDDNAPPLCWRLGKIVELHPGRDKLVRTASIKTMTGIIQRTLPKICPLPIDD